MTITFTDLLDDLGTKSESAATAVVTRYLADDLTLNEASTALAVVVRTSNARGVTLGSATCREILRTFGETAMFTVLPAAVAHADDVARIVKAATTALAVREAAQMSATRLARSEAISAAHSAFSSVLGQSEKVDGWTRELSPGACELCTWWWRNGRVWPKNYTIQTHKGCTCRQKPVKTTKSDIRNPIERSWRASDQRRLAQNKEKTS